MQKITPFFWYDEQAEEAVTLYTSIFKNSRIHAVTHFGDDVPGPSGKVMTIDFQLAGREFAALNGGPQFKFNPSVSFFVYCQTPEEIDTLWAQLVEGGSILMEYQQYPFSEKYGWLADRYGVSWQLMLNRQPQQIVPSLMFVGSQAGRAEEAMQLYTSLFKNARIDQISYYEKGQGEPEGNVVHGNFTLEGQAYIAFDSSLDHRFSFNEALSFVVNCADQSEVDYFWEKLSDGGEKSMCGWLKDRFGVSWQIVPTALTEMMSDPDPERASRVTQAMLKMTKIDIGALRQAYG